MRIFVLFEFQKLFVNEDFFVSKAVKQMRPPIYSNSFALIPNYFQIFAQLRKFKDFLTKLI
jgi:hypothetical protein